MKLFKRLFGKEQVSVNEKTEETKTSNTSKTAAETTDKWEEVPAFIAASPDDYEKVSVIATAIASGDNPESQFTVKQILQRNPEAKDVAIIATSVAAGASDNSLMVVKNIKKKKA